MLDKRCGKAVLKTETENLIREASLKPPWLSLIPAVEEVFGMRTMCVRSQLGYPRKLGSMVRINGL